MDDALFCQLVRLVERLAVAVERLEPAASRVEREQKADNQKRRERLAEWENRRLWAQNQGLSDTRAAKAWARSGLTVQETTRGRLRDVRNCGEKTKAVIMDWVRSLSDPA
jgi:hypothetical protein